MLNLFFFCFFACDIIDSFTKSPAERLINVRAQRTQIMDTLYTSYGGGTLTNDVKDKINSAIDKKARKKKHKLAKAFKNTVSEVDRTRFEKHCLTIGNGNHAEILENKAKDFFENPQNINLCKRVAVLDLKISELELMLPSDD